MNKHFFVYSFFLLLAFFFSSSILARIGVGIGTGKIYVDQKLKPGQIYTLPSVTIINTGDVSGEYSIDVAYHDKQKELRPDKKWFIFKPKTFTLDPGEVQVVDMKLDLPVSMKPGDYFAYIEGFPAQKSEGGQATIGIAAATKLYFTVVPANIFQGMYYKFVSLWTEYEPWSTRLSVTLIVLVLIAILRRFVNIDINIKGKNNAKES